VHLCGTGHVDNLLLTQPGYKQFEYLKGDLKDVLAMADIVVSRAGANAICELLALKKPNLLIPLSKAASRGDQILNAASFEVQGYSLVLQEEDMDTFSLTSKIHDLYENRDKYIETMTASSQGNAIDIVLGLIEEYSSSTIKVKK
jgi:UDP-N-acetylglucosamine--N-acetylmuramyl-(pentapeptide) pyrophosphoryl-undecaprenol N-acetylglucosamine transferase